MIKKLARYGVLFAMLLFLSGCDATSDRSDKPSPDWSRGLRIGVASVNQPVALQVDGEGHAHLVWYTQTEGVSKLHYTQLDDQAQVVVERDLDVPLPDLPYKLQLLLDGRGNIHLAWLAREDSARSLFHLLLGYDGETLSEPTRLSFPSAASSRGGEVRSYQMCLSQDGLVEVLGAIEEGIYHLRLDERGEVISPPVLIVSQGTDPSAQVDRSGTIHLAWLQEPSPQVKELYYAAFDPYFDYPFDPSTLRPFDPSTGLRASWAQGKLGSGQALLRASFAQGKAQDRQRVGEPLKGIKLTQFYKAVTAVLHGPVLGLDTEEVYIFWALEPRSGSGVGTARSYYVSFPLEPGPGQSPLSPTPIRMPTLEPVYISSQGAYHYRWLARPLERWDSDFVAMPSVVEGQRDELAVMFNARANFRLKAYLDGSEIVVQEMPGGPGVRPEIQLAMAIFTKGNMKGYQIAARTDSVSLRPSLVVDSASNLHLAWIDTAGFGRYDVYYASTSPEAKAWLDRTSPQDVLLKAVELAWGVLSGLALCPLAGLWVFPALLWLALFYILAGEDELELRRVKVALGIAIALYMGTKLVLLPGFLFYVPFLDQVPPHLSPALVLGVPLILFTMALAVLYAYTRRAERATLFLAFFVFVLTDALLSLAIYAPRFFGGL